MRRGEGSIISHAFSINLNTKFVFPQPVGPATSAVKGWRRGSVILSSTSRLQNAADANRERMLSVHLEKQRIALMLYRQFHAAAVAAPRRDSRRDMYRSVSWYNWRFPSKQSCCGPIQDACGLYQVPHMVSTSRVLHGFAHRVIKGTTWATP